MRSKGGLHTQSVLYGLMLLLAIVVMSLAAYSISYYDGLVNTTYYVSGGVTPPNIVSPRYTTIVTSTLTYFNTYSTFFTTTSDRTWSYSTFLTTTVGFIDGRLTTRRTSTMDFYYSTTTRRTSTLDFTSSYRTFTTSSYGYWDKRDQTRLAAQTGVPAIQTGARSGTVAPSTSVAPAPTATFVPAAASATITTAPAVVTEIVQVEVEVEVEAPEAPRARQLVKRRRGSSSGGGSQVSVNWADAWRPLRIVELVWALCTILYLSIFFIVRQVKSSSGFVKVSSDKGWLSFLFVFGFIVQAVSAGWYGTYSGFTFLKGFPAAAALMAFCWLLVVLLFATLIFETVYGRKTMGKQTHMSIRQWVNTEPEVLSPPIVPGKDSASTMYGSPMGTPNGQPVMMQYPIAARSHSSMVPAGMVPMGQPIPMGMGAPGMPGSPPMSVSDNASGNLTPYGQQQQMMYQPQGQPPPCMCNTYGYPHPPHLMAGWPPTNPVSPAITPLQV